MKNTFFKIVSLLAILFFPVSMISAAPENAPGVEKKSPPTISNAQIFYGQGFVTVTWDTDVPCEGFIEATYEGWGEFSEVLLYPDEGNKIHHKVTVQAGYSDLRIVVDGGKYGVTIQDI